DAAVVVHHDRGELAEEVGDERDHGDAQDVEHRDTDHAERGDLEARAERVLALEAGRHGECEEEDRLPADAVPGDVKREAAGSAADIQERAVVSGGDTEERERAVHEPALDRRDPLAKPGVEAGGHREVGQQFAESREEREDEQGDRGRGEERADRTRRTGEVRIGAKRGGHGRLRFHQRAPNGSAGARRSRPTTPSGTTVAMVSFQGCDPPSYESHVAQFAESFGASASSSSWSPAAKATALVANVEEASVAVVGPVTWAVPDPSSWPGRSAKMIPPPPPATLEVAVLVPVAAGGPACSTSACSIVTNVVPVPAARSVRP